MLSSPKSGKAKGIKKYSVAKRPSSSSAVVKCGKALGLVMIFVLSWFSGFQAFRFANWFSGFQVFRLACMFSSLWLFGSSGFHVFRWV